LKFCRSTQCCLLQWVEAVAGLVVGMMAAVGSYSLGMHAALAIDR
jgi:hypothetical protein